MSNSLAIAAITATLRNILLPMTEGMPQVDGWDLNSFDVTTKPLDKARDGNGNQINIFLYQATPNAALRNMEMPGRLRPGETGPFPLALDLHYLLTAYGNGDDEVIAHALLGQALLILHDNTVLTDNDINAAFSLNGNDPYDQIEQVRLTSESLSSEELSKLWTATPYRLSAAIKASALLIDSGRPARTPLPVLTRGKSDVGPSAQASLLPPYPTLEQVVLPHRQTSAQSGDTLTLQGHHLDGANIRILFANRRLANPNRLDANANATASEIEVTIPQDPSNWPAGFYTVSANLISPGETAPRTTNESSFPLAPRITMSLPMTVNRDANETASVELDCEPDVLPRQRAALLLGGREVPSEPHETKTGKLEFVIENAPLGEHLVRLRVDGVDSQLVDRSQSPPRFFQHTITIQQMA